MMVPTGSSRQLGGGGVFVKSAVTFRIFDSEITDNTADTGGRSVGRLERQGTVTLIADMDRRRLLIALLILLVLQNIGIDTRYLTLGGL